MDMKIVHFWWMILQVGTVRNKPSQCLDHTKNLSGSSREIDRDYVQKYMLAHRISQPEVPTNGV